MKKSKNEINRCALIFFLGWFYKLALLDFELILRSKCKRVKECSELHD